MMYRIYDENTNYTGLAFETIEAWENHLYSQSDMIRFDAFWENDALVYTVEYGEEYFYKYFYVFLEA